MRIRPFRSAGVLVLGLTLAAGASGVSAARHAATPTWITTKGKTINLKIIAGYNSAVNGFNFNGYGQGKMTITVPTGDTVAVTFSNAAAVPHSAQIVAYSKTPPTASVPDAFKGANTPSPMNGTAKGTVVKFSFKASKAGKYLLICAVPGHTSIGMWDNFVVSSSAKSGSIKTGK